MWTLSRQFLNPFENQVYFYYPLEVNTTSPLVLIPLRIRSISTRGRGLKRTAASRLNPFENQVYFYNV